MLVNSDKNITHKCWLLLGFCCGLSKNITFHSLRHSFATYFLVNGGDILVLKSMLGHTSLNTTMIYLHLAQNFNKLEGINYD